MRATEIATDYASRRDSFDKKLKDHQAIQAMISDSHIDILASRLMIQHVAAKLDSDGPLKSKHESSMAKVFVSEAVSRPVDRAVQICGALGVSEDTPLSPRHPAVSHLRRRERSASHGARAAHFSQAAAAVTPSA